MDFNKALQTVDSNFESILEIMKLRRNPKDIDSVRNLLLTINIIIDYFLDREDNDLKIPVAYFPECSEETQEIAEDFVCLKMGFYTSQDWKSFVSDNLNKQAFVIPADVKTQKQMKLAHENFKFEKSLSRILDRSRHEVYGYGKSLVYSDYLYKCWSEHRVSSRTYNRKTVNRFWYLSHCITNFDNIFTNEYHLSLVPEDPDKFYEEITEYDGDVRIENLIVFPTKTPDGRYADYCHEAFQKPYLDDFVNSGIGLRNVFFFCFSKKPYRLRRLLDFKQRMKERLQVFDDESFDFISFTYSEALQLTGKRVIKPLTIALGKDYSDLQQDYENLFDDITNGLERYIARRNEMSLCISEPSQEKYSSKLIDESEADENLIREIFNIHSLLWNENAEMQVKHFVYHSDVYVITGNDISEELKINFKNYLTSKCEAFKVKIGTFGDLRGYNENGTYQNGIKFPKIIIMSFRNDYTESIFHKYPNSFDPYCINPWQKVLEIDNYFFLRQYYEWGKYNYGKAMRKILKSEFRNSEMKPQFVEYKRPVKKLPEDTREEELDRNTSRTVQQTVVQFSDNSQRSYNRSEWMLYKYGSNKGIAPLSDLLDLYESCNELQIQSLTPLVKLVYNNRVDSENEKDNRSEKMFKEQPSYGLSQEEIDSDVQLWKILLRKKVEQSSYHEVYDEIMSHFNERYIVSFFSFKRWLDPEYGIPRARKMQKYIVEDYLGIRPPYINLIRRIKERTKNDTESITTSIRHFLSLALLTTNYKDVLNALSEETLDLLDISTTDDIEQILSEVEEKINYESVKNIKQ